MKCINCGFEWEAQVARVVTCPSCGLEAEYVRDEKSYERGVKAEHEKRYDDAVKAYKTAADYNVPCAAYKVYRVMGEQKNPDKEKLALWLHTSAESGDPIACYEWATGLRSDVKERVYWLSRSAAVGHEGACLKLAWYFSLHKNYSAARYYLTLGAPSGKLCALWLMLLGKKKAADKPELAEPKSRQEQRTKLAAELEAEGCYRLAYRFYSTESDCAKALYRMAHLELEGKCDEEVSFEQTEKRLIRSGELGMTLSYRELAEIYEEGKVTERDAKKAFSLYLLAAEGGDVGAQKRVGDACFDGDLCNRDVERAISWYEKAARAGDEEAAKRVDEIGRALASAFERAQQAKAGGEVEEAAQIYIKCADIGHTPSCCNIGMCYQLGEGVPRSYCKAAYYYEKAVLGGSIAATYNLGMLYSENLGVRFSFKRAIGLLDVAAKNGYPQATRMAQKLRERRKVKLTRGVYSTACELYFMGKREQSMKYLVTAAAMGCADAMYMLGCHAEYGDGIAQNAEVAAVWYKKAADAGYDGERGRLKRGFLRQQRLLMYKE